VSIWRDKSGNGYDGTTTNASVGSPVAPTYVTNSINGLSAVTMSGTSYFTGSTNVNSTTLTAFFVGNCVFGTGGSSQQRILGLGVTGLDDYSSTLRPIPLSVVYSGTTLLAYRNANMATATIVSGTNFVGCCVFDSTSNYMYKDGKLGTQVASSGTFTTSIYGVGSDAGTQYMGGTSSLGTNCLVGKIGEMIVFNTALTTTQRQQVEGYLAAKWGLLSSVVSGHPFKSIPPSTSQPPQFQEVTPGNWTYDWQPYLQRLAAANSSGVTVTTSNITGGATFTSYGWVGGVLAPNGNIYFAPLVATNILVLNPTTGVTSNLTGGATYSANGWAGGVLAPNGNIYFCPHWATNILVLNPTTGVTSNLTGGATYPGGSSGAWFGGVLAPNGNIYFCPYNAANILVLNPTTGVTSNLTGGATYTAVGWGGGVLAPNGNIYFCPNNAANILVLNPTTGVTSNLTGGATYTASGWGGGVLAPNGNIYFCPNSAANILVLNPTTGVTSNLTGGATYRTPNGWTGGGLLAPNGNIYFIPYSATNVLVLNPTTGVTSNLTGGATYPSAGSGAWYGGVLAPNGNIYAAPSFTTNILTVTLSGLSQTPSLSYCLSAWTNKY
jgi:streptogramin lyase